MTKNLKHSQPAIAQANGIEICYDTFGDADAPAMLLIAGMGNQMIEWDDELCVHLAAYGYWVIRYDNRDVGKSSKVTRPGDLAQQPYTFCDMVDDAVGLLDALGVERAHVVGISMGGCLAQLLAIHHPDRIRTLTSMQSFAKGAPVAAPTLSNLPVKLPESTEHDAFLREYVDWEQFIGGARYMRSEASLRAKGETILARGLTVEGRVGHAAAMVATPDWYADLPSIKSPALVIHGDADPLVPVQLGVSTANAIAGCKLMIIEGWGHGFPAPVLWLQISGAIARHAR